MVEEARIVVNVCLRRGNSPFPFCYGYMRESQYSLWASTQHANNWNFNPASAPEVSFARECARTTLKYYDRGLEIAESANVARLYEHAVAFVVPGGIDNLRNFAFEGLPAFEFVSNIGRDLAVDVATCKAGRFVSRMARTSLQSANQARVLSRGGRGNRAQEVRVARERSTPADQLNFLNRKIANGKWIPTRHKIGGKKAYYEESTDLWYTKVEREKNDFEVWRVSGRRARHQGAIEPKNGTMYEGPSHSDALFE